MSSPTSFQFQATDGSLQNWEEIRESLTSHLYVSIAAIGVSAKLAMYNVMQGLEMQDFCEEESSLEKRTIVSLQGNEERQAFLSLQISHTRGDVISLYSDNPKGVHVIHRLARNILLGESWDDNETLPHSSLRGGISGYYFIEELSTRSDFSIEQEEIDFHWIHSFLSEIGPIISIIPKKEVKVDTAPLKPTTPIDEPPASAESLEPPSALLQDLPRNPTTPIEEPPAPAESLEPPSALLQDLPRNPTTPIRNPPTYEESLRLSSALSQGLQEKEKTTSPTGVEREAASVSQQQASPRRVSPIEVVTNPDDSMIPIEFLYNENSSSSHRFWWVLPGGYYRDGSGKLVQCQSHFLMLGKGSYVISNSLIHVVGDDKPYPFQISKKIVGGSKEVCAKIQLRYSYFQRQTECRICLPFPMKSFFDRRNGKEDRFIFPDIRIVSSDSGQEANVLPPLGRPPAATSAPAFQESSPGTVPLQGIAQESNSRFSLFPTQNGIRTVFWPLPGQILSLEDGSFLNHEGHRYCAVHTSFWVAHAEPVQIPT